MSRLERSMVTIYDIIKNTMGFQVWHGWYREKTNGHSTRGMG